MAEPDRPTGVGTQEPKPATPMAGFLAHSIRGNGSFTASNARAVAAGTFAARRADVSTLDSQKSLRIRATLKHVWTHAIGLAAGVTLPWAIVQPFGTCPVG